MKYIKYGLVLLCIGMLFAACKKECIHQYEAKITISESCSQVGEKTFTCVHCGDHYTETIATLEHTYGTGKTEKPATCAEEGIEKYLCTVCGAEKYESIAKLSHILAENGTVTKEPNCSQTGECTKVCTVCGESVLETIATNGVHVFTNTVVREATCIDPGEGINTCQLCEYQESCQYNLKEHFMVTQEILTEATCTKNGEKRISCSVCGYSVNETVKSPGHQWVGATCTKEGTCSVCGITGNKVDHAYVTLEEKDETTYSFGYRKLKCSACNDERTEHFKYHYTFSLDAMTEGIATYAENKGFHTSIGTVENTHFKASVTSTEMVGNGRNASYVVGKAITYIDEVYDLCMSMSIDPQYFTIHIEVICSGNVVSSFIELTSP